jgi:hypothetical protein
MSGIDTKDLSAMKLGTLQKRADWNNRVPRFDTASPGFDQKRLKREVIVAVDESDFEIVIADLPLQSPRTIGAAKAAAKNDDSFD